jgi:hypothetical protein
MREPRASPTQTVSGTPDNVGLKDQWRSNPKFVHRRKSDWEAGLREMAAAKPGLADQLGAMDIVHDSSTESALYPGPYPATRCY